MNPRRIWGVLVQEAYLTAHSLEVIIDVLVFPLIGVIVFGLISLYLVGSDQSLAAQYVLLGMILWQVLWIVAYSIAVGGMWNIWSRNLSNMFIAPLRVGEYVFALFLSGCVKAVILLGVAAFFSVYAFHFNLLSIGIPAIALVFLSFSIFGFSVAVFVLGLIFRYGTRVAALSWSLITMVQPLCAAFFPLSAMPHALQIIALLLPPTYAYEAARYALLHHGEVEWRLFGFSLLLGFLYCLVAAFLFERFFRISRDTGQFARNEA